MTMRSALTAIAAAVVAAFTPRSIDHPYPDLIDAGWGYWDRPAEPRDLTHEECRHIYDHGTCPYCGHNLVNGPRGGASINLFCDNVDECDSRFNVLDREMGFLPWGEFTGPVPDDFREYIHTARGAA